MALIHNRDKVNELLISAGTYVYTLSNAIEKASKSYESLQKEDMSGTTAETIKQFLQSLNMLAQGTGNMVLLSLDMAVNRYSGLSEAMDGDTHAIVPQENLENLKDAFNEQKGSDLKNQAQLLNTEVEKALEACRSLIDVGFLSPVTGEAAAESVRAVMTAAQEALEKLDETENRFANDSNVTAALEGAAALESMARLAISGFMSGTFDPNTFAASSEFQALIQAYEDMESAARENEDSYNASLAVNKTIYDKLTKEYEQRKAEADAVKLVGIGLCILASVAVSIATAGMAAPAAIAITAGVTGTVTGLTYAAGSAMDQRVGTIAAKGKIDGAVCFKEGMKGFIVGTVTGAISGAAGQAVGNLGKAAPIGKKIAIKAIEGGASKLSSEIIEKTIDGEKINVGELAVTTLFSAGASAVSTFVGEKLIACFDIKSVSRFNSVKQNLSIAGKKTAVETIKGGIKGAVNGTGKQIISAVKGEGFQLDELWRDIKKSAVKGGIDGAVNQLFTIGTFKTFEAKEDRQFSKTMAEIHSYLVVGDIGKACETIDTLKTNSEISAEIDDSAKWVGDRVKDTSGTGEGISDILFEEDEEFLKQQKKFLNSINENDTPAKKTVPISDLLDAAKPLKDN